MKQTSSKNLKTTNAEQVLVHLRMRPHSEDESYRENNSQMIEMYDPDRKLIVGKT